MSIYLFYLFLSTFYLIEHCSIHLAVWVKIANFVMQYIICLAHGCKRV